MARLEAQIKGLYYPTPVEEIEIFMKKHLKIHGYGYISFFDPCCGKGEILNALARCSSWSSRFGTYGVELEKNRAQEAMSLIHTVVHGSFEDITIENGYPTVILFNPPYDVNTDGRRVELDWLDMISPFMGYNSVLIAVLPDRFCEGGENYNDFRMALGRNKLFQPSADSGYWREKNEIAAFRFTDANYPQFKQVIIPLRKRIDYGTSIPESVKVIGVNGEVDKSFYWRVVDENSNNKNRELVLIRNPPSEYQSCAKGMIEKILGDPDKFSKIRPLQELRAETVATLVAAGYFTGIRMGNQLIRGGTIIRNTTKKYKGEDDKEVEEIIPRLIVIFSSLDLTTGDITSFESSTPEFDEMLEKLAPQLADIVKESNPSKYESSSIEKYLPRFSDIRGPRAQDDGSNVILDAQRHAIAAILRNWEDEKATLLLGEMGVGKTIVSIAAAVAYVRNRKPENQKIIVMLTAKDDLVSKWEEEIRYSLKDVGVEVFDIRTLRDVDRAFAYKGLAFLLVKETILKRTSGAKMLAYGKKCPFCGKEALLVNENGDLPKSDNEELFCKHCGESYKTYIRNPVGKGNVVDDARAYVARNFPDLKLTRDDLDAAARITEQHYEVFGKPGFYGQPGQSYSSIAKYIRAYYPLRYIVIADEAHNYKGGETARGYAAHAIFKAASKILLMTGTLYNGYASSLFFNWYRANREMRDKYNFRDVKSFVQAYGLEKTIISEKQKAGRYSSYGYTQKVKNTKEIPGIHPGMIAMILPNTVFLKIEDLKISLPPLIEKTVFVDFDESAYSKISSWLSILKDKGMREKKDTGDNSILSQWMWAQNGAWDYCHATDTIAENSITIGSLHDAPNAKEEVALRITWMDKLVNKPTLIYYLPTTRRPIAERFSLIGKRHAGLNIVEMPNTVKERKPWIIEAIGNGADAIIMNPELVKEGIDLLMFGSIIWFQPIDNPITIAQANRRLWRIGRRDPVNIYFLGWNKTYQSEVWVRTAAKLAAMQAVHANVRSGIAALLGEDSIISTVQAKLMGNYQRYESDIRPEDLPTLVSLMAQVQPNVPSPIKEEVVELIQMPTSIPVKWDDTEVTQLTMF